MDQNQSRYSKLSKAYDLRLAKAKQIFDLTMEFCAHLASFESLSANQKIQNHHSLELVVNTRGKRVSQLGFKYELGAEVLSVFAFSEHEFKILLEKTKIRG